MFASQKTLDLSIFPQRVTTKTPNAEYSGASFNLTARNMGPGSKTFASRASKQLIANVVE